MSKLIRISIALWVLLVSCTIPATTKPPDSPLNYPTSTQRQAVDCEEREPIMVDSETLAAGINTMAFDLYQTIAQKSDENLVYSPYSTASAFSMAYAGAREQTEKEMAQVLHFLPQEVQHPALHALDFHLNSLDESAGTMSNANQETVTPFHLNVVNSAWGQATFPFKQSYLAMLTQDYSSGLQLVDFVANPAPAIEQINHWVDEQTAGRIKELVSGNEITQDTHLVLDQKRFDR
jgi:serpin B